MTSGKVQDLVLGIEITSIPFLFARRMPLNDVKLGQGVPVPPNAKQAH